MDYDLLAQQVLDAVGGPKNVKHVTHCATRLRMQLVNDALADIDETKAIPGVLGVVTSGGQFQVVIGNDVSHVYDRVAAAVEAQTSNGNVQSEPEVADGEKPGIVQRLLDVIAAIFTPILPVVVGAAMVKTILILLTNVTGWLSTDSGGYVVLNFCADAAFFFMPLLLGHSAGRKFGMNPYMATILGGFMVHPTFMGLVNADPREPLSFFGLPVTLANYSSTVIPVILVVWIGSYVEKFADRVSPKSVRFFLKPMLTFLIMIPGTLVVVGPLGALLGSGVAAGLSYLYTTVPWLIGPIMGVAAPLLVMTGMHYALIPIVIQSMGTYGFDLMGIGYLIANVAQGSAAIAAGLRAKNPTFRQLAFSSGGTAFVGVSEPAMYGVNIRLRRPFYFVLAAGLLAGIWAGITHVARLSFAPTGLLTVPIFIDPNNSMNLINALICAAIAAVVAFTLTYFFGVPKNDPAVQKAIGDADAALSNA